MKREYLISLLYIPLTVCVTLPQNAKAKEVTSVNETNTVDLKDTQAALLNAQNIFENAIVEEINAMDMNEIRNIVSEDFEKMFKDIATDENSLDGVTLKEDAGLGNLFSGLEDGLKGLVPNPDKFKDAFDHHKNSRNKSGFSFNITMGGDKPSVSYNISNTGFNASSSDDQSSDSKGNVGLLGSLFGKPLFGNHDGSSSNNGSHFEFHFGTGGSGGSSGSNDSNTNTVTFPNLFGGFSGGASGSGNGSDSGFHLPSLFGGSNNANGSISLNLPGLPPLPGLPAIPGLPSLPGLPAIPGLTGSANGGPDLFHTITAGIKGATDNLFNQDGAFHFGSGTGLENFAGLSGSAIGNLFKGNLFDNIGKGFGAIGFGSFGRKVEEVVKNVINKIENFIPDLIDILFPDPATHTGLSGIPILGGILNTVGSTVTDTIKNLDGLFGNLLPKVGHFTVHSLPGFRRYQTHEHMVEDLGNLKNIFLGAMRVQSPMAADQFEIFFDKMNQLLEYANQVDPTISKVLDDPSEENFRVSLQSLSKVLSSLD